MCLKIWNYQFIYFRDIILNRKYKDTFFAALFNDPQYAFEVYHELHPEDTDIDVTDIELITLRNMFTIDYYNDACILAKKRMIVLTEHQSAINENMPMRMLLYISEEYKRLFADNKRLLHSRNLVKVPVPEFYIIYTGEKEWRDSMHLSNSFYRYTNSLELIVNVISSPSQGGIIGEFINFTKEITLLIKQTGDKIGSIKKVIEKYKNDAYRISNFLRKREDVADMINEGITLAEAFEIEKENGRQEGRQEGRILTLWELGFSLDDCILKTGETEEFIKGILARNGITI